MATQKFKAETIRILATFITTAVTTYIVARIYIYWDVYHAMAPNEWGDFFAGATGPLAFFWLILGYQQQGEQLRISNEELHATASANADQAYAVERTSKSQERLEQNAEKQRQIMKLDFELRHKQAIQSARATIQIVDVRVHSAKIESSSNPKLGPFSNTETLVDFFIQSLGNTANDVFVELCREYDETGQGNCSLECKENSFRFKNGFRVPILKSDQYAAFGIRIDHLPDGNWFAPIKITHTNKNGKTDQSLFLICADPYGINSHHLRLNNSNEYYKYENYISDVIKGNMKLLNQMNTIEKPIERKKIF
ncbi:hypothetical protein [Donghicola tyrosinivorans]|uniref:Uncharacterized protein n=1 Tax=Donghicola tyrosinivorans TaxID=1652492 RepID=A0A2T0X4S9_9RHOB|nr:hypothetical protein [Donghicola tyrosinivorans]PRY93952.1 hypothetical protein CLV74_10182 [Donghicola tyrosinivorans]